MRRSSDMQRAARSGLIVAALGALAAWGAVAAPATRVDHVLIKDLPVGRQSVHADARAGSADFSYNDRGRGEEIHARWQLDASGLPTEYSGRGHDENGAAFVESFSRSGAQARWSSRLEHGSSALAGAAFYLPANPPPEFLNVLARALLKAPGQRLALLPAGAASIEAAAPLELTLAGGRRLALAQYRITGLDFQPVSVWLDPAGSAAARATDWLSVLPEGWGSSVAPLLAAVTASDAAWSAGLARRLAHPYAGPLVIRHARLFDPRDLGVTEGVSVEIRGEWIVRVDADGALVPPAGAEVLEANGAFLMPGLWDNHEHFEGVHGALDLASGVTSTRDMANDTDVFLERVARFEAGTELGPRVFLAGVIDGNGPFAAPTKMRPDTAAEALADVDWYAAHGYGQIKIYSSAKAELVPLIVDAGHAHGLRVSGHVPIGMTARQFIAAGTDEIQHLHFIAYDALRLLGREVEARMPALGPLAHEIDPADPRVRELIALLVRRHIVLDPTVNLYEGLYCGDAAAVSPGLEAIASRLPAQVRRQLLSGAYPVPAGREAAFRDAFPALLRLLKALHDAGVTIIPGTDSMSGYGLHLELRDYVRAGISPAEALRMATLTSAEVSGVARERGLVAPGKRADLILIDGDPSRRIEDLGKVRTVFKGGVRFESEEIEHALGIAPR